MTFADLLTATGAGTAAVIVTLTVSVIKTGLANTPVGKWDGAVMAFVLSFVLYLLAGAATSAVTLDAMFLVFMSWLTCAAAALGVHKGVVNPIIKAAKKESESD